MAAGYGARRHCRALGLVGIHFLLSMSDHGGSLDGCYRHLERCKVWRRGGRGHRCGVHGCEEARSRARCESFGEAEATSTSAKCHAFEPTMCVRMQCYSRMPFRNISSVTLTEKGRLNVSSCALVHGVIGCGEPHLAFKQTIIITITVTIISLPNFLL